ncbi:hypothetical protein E2C01_010889 [Portunus trituberculatus]|uniref:Uncharacterized protein n=1 Tax=Portunus trituberculatus TaxID=210409 RepID=A0A5B7D9K5_PORTR|nr:hypothetical protein [Portunus trituberculatus]
MKTNAPNAGGGRSDNTAHTYKRITRTMLLDIYLVSCVASDTTPQLPVHQSHPLHSPTPLHLQRLLHPPMLPTHPKRTHGKQTRRLFRLASSSAARRAINNNERN